jgi:hypothetical protein
MICSNAPSLSYFKFFLTAEAADFLGPYTLGTTVPVDMWEFHGPFNTSMRTAVLHDDCVPVSEEISMNRGSKYPNNIQRDENYKRFVHFSKHNMVGPNTETLIIV